MTRRRPGRSTASGRAARSGGIKKIIAIVLIAAILIGAGVVFVPRLVHHCDRCNKFFIGTGYYANALSDALSTLQGKDGKILCSECAQDEHALEILAGKTLDDFRRPLFETDGD